MDQILANLYQKPVLAISIGGDEQHMHMVDYEKQGVGAAAKFLQLDEELPESHMEVRFEYTVPSPYNESEESTSKYLNMFKGTIISYLVSTGRAHIDNITFK